MSIHKLRRSWIFFFYCCLICLLSACAPMLSSNTTPSQTTGTQTVSEHQVPTNTPQTTPITVPMPATQTSCPATNTTRAMVTEPLVLGNDPTIVYTANQTYPQSSNNDPLMGTLKRYDVKTGNKTVIASIPNMQISNAQISADGQWILFISSSKTISNQQGPEREVMLQAVRMDGQGLQTLYCTTTYHADFTNIQWSPDMQSIAILRDASDNATPNPNEIVSVQLLRTSTGQFQTIFSSTPSVRATIGFRTWADNTHIYMYGTGENTEQNIYLLDTTKGINQHENDLTTILNGQFKSFTSDGTKLYIDYNGCDQVSCSPPSKVIAMPATGGTSQTIWQSTQYNVTEACPINNHQLLVAIENLQQQSGPTDTSHNGIWIMNSDGTLAQQLTSAGANTSIIGNCFSQWSHGSRAGNMYAVNVPSGSQLIFGTDNSGTSTSFATYGGALLANVVGWTTM